MNPRVRIVHPNLPGTYLRPILVTERAFKVWERRGWQRHTEEPSTTPTGTVAEVLEWVASDPARAATALMVEASRPWPRSTLTSQLHSLLEEE